MAFTLDIKTLAVILAVTLAISALVMMLLYRLHPTMSGPREWAAGMTLAAVGFFMIFARGLIPDFISIVVANGMIALGHAILYNGMRLFAGLRPSFVAPAMIIMGTWFPFFFLYGSDQYLAVRIVAGGATTTLFSLMIAVVLVRNSVPGLTARRVTATIFLLHSLVNLLRCGWTVFDPPIGGSLMQAGPATAMIYTWSIAGTFAITASSAVMATERLSDALSSRIHELDDAHTMTKASIAKERQAMLEQRNFLAMVSHEFRTPLGIMNASTAVIEYNLPESDLESAEELERIRRAISRLINLVDGCLADEWLEATCDLRRMARIDLCSLLVDLTSEHGLLLTLETPCPAYVDADPYLLPIAIANLIDNARKYGRTKEGVTIHCLQGSKNEIIVKVSDDGPGIDPVELPRIFEKFYRSPRVGRKPGAGLGLYLVRRIADLHGYRIEVAAGNAGGTVFKIVLPHQTGEAG